MELITRFKLYFLITIVLQPDGINLRYFKLKLLDLAEFKLMVYDTRLQNIKELEN